MDELKKNYFAGIREDRSKEIQQRFGLASPLSLESLEQARDKLDQEFKAYVASLSARSLDNLAEVQRKLGEFQELIEWIGERHDLAIDRVRSEVAHGLADGAAMI